MSHTYKYPRPSVTTDIILFNWTGDRLSVALIRRKEDPFKGKWAFPGGFLEMDEDLGVCARRELKEETNLDVDDLIQLGAFGAPDRDPRGRVISVAFIGFAKPESKAHAGSDAQEIGWHDLSDLPELAFDHREMLSRAIERLRAIFYVGLNQNHVPFGFSGDDGNKIFELLNKED